MRAVVGLCLLSCIPTSRVSADALERMKRDRLEATRAAVTALAAERQPVELKSEYTDYRAVIHVHSAFSHDSRGTPEEIRAAAKEAGVSVVLFTEHPAPHYDYFTDGHRGVVDGVLFIPGAETGGFLALPTRSLKGAPNEPPQAFADLVREGDGLVFLSHLEERMDWDIAGMTGSEIYNIHADLKDETGLVAALRQPLRVLGLVGLLEKYGQEVFAALQDYPADYLRRYDELCQKGRLTGVAANDAHHNQAIRACVADGGKLEIFGGLGEKVATLDPEKMPLVKGFVQNKQPGDTVIHVDLDPYVRSFRHVSTHLLMKELAPAAVWQALKAGRAYVGFDWMADPTGFVFQAKSSGACSPMGCELSLAEGLQLEVAAPMHASFRLIRDGQIVQEESGRSLLFAVREPGVYRAEAWLDLAGERRIWILSNPIYVRQSA